MVLNPEIMQTQLFADIFSQILLKINSSALMESGHKMDLTLLETVILTSSQLQPRIQL